MDEHEPIGWMVYTLDGTAVYVTDNPTDFTENHRALPLYTDPPAREWVGLTLNEAEDFYEKYTDRAVLINAIDKFLEEKNA